MADSTIDDILQNWLVIDEQSIPKFIIIIVAIVAVIAVIMLLASNANNATTTTITTGNSTTSTSSTTSIVPGEANITVIYGNIPAVGAHVSIRGSYNGTTGAGGDMNTGYSVNPGAYFVFVTYNGVESSTNITVSAGQIAYTTIIMPGPIITVIPTTESTSLSTSTIDDG